MSNSGVTCPKCGAANMWDNRATKKNPKAPDFKCRDKGCDGVVWPPKPGQQSPYAAPTLPQHPPKGAPVPVEQPRDIGNLPDWVIDQEAAEQGAVAGIKAAEAQQDERGAQAFASVCTLHTAALQHVLAHEVALIEHALGEGSMTAEAVSALTAQIVIESNRRGIVLPGVVAQRRVA